MVEFDTKIKKRGNSFVILIPDEKLKEGNFIEDDEVHVWSWRKTVK